MIRVLVADDQPLLRQAMHAILAAQPDIDLVAEASDGAQAVRLAVEHRVDVAVLNVRMPGMDGLHATRLLAETAPSVSVLVLTTFDLDEYVLQALRSGASGFLIKTSPTDEIIRAIRTVAAGEALLAPSVTRRLLHRFVAAPPTPQPAPEHQTRLQRLTQRETQILRELARGNSNAEIAEHLTIGAETVKTHVSRILTKLDLRDRVHAVIFAYESGLVTTHQQ